MQEVAWQLAARRHAKGCKFAAWILRRIVVPKKKKKSYLSEERANTCFPKTHRGLLAGTTTDGSGS